MSAQPDIQKQADFLLRHATWETFVNAYRVADQETRDAFNKAVEVNPTEAMSWGQSMVEAYCYMKAAGHI